MAMDYGMEILTIIAILIGPFLGIYVYGKIEDRKHAYNRKLDVYKTLMATRGTQLSPDYVNALNRIDVEFTADDEKAVRDVDLHRNLSQKSPFLASKSDPSTVP